MAEFISSPKPAGEGKISNGGTAFVGAGAVDVLRATYLAAHLDLWAKTGIKPTRGVGITQMLKMAQEYTGVKYKRTEATQAAEAVRRWAEDAHQSMTPKA